MDWDIKLVQSNQQSVDANSYIAAVEKYLAQEPFNRARRMSSPGYRPEEETIEYLLSKLILSTLKTQDYQTNRKAELSYKCFYLLVIEALWRSLIYSKFRLDDPWFKTHLQLNKQTRKVAEPHITLQAHTCLAVWKMLERLSSLGRYAIAPTSFFYLLWYDPSGLMLVSSTPPISQHTEARNYHNEAQNYLRNIKGLYYYNKQKPDYTDKPQIINPFSQWPAADFFLSLARKEANNSHHFFQEFYKPFVNARSKLVNYTNKQPRLLILTHPEQGVIAKAVR